MRILGPLVCSSTSRVTATFSRSLAALVTFAPSTTRATGSETSAPGSPSSFSTLTTSPTATLYCLPPVLTIAYVAIVPLLSGRALPVGARAGLGAEPRWARCHRHQPKDNWSRVRETRLGSQISAGHDGSVVVNGRTCRSSCGATARTAAADRGSGGVLVVILVVVGVLVVGVLVVGVLVVGVLVVVGVIVVRVVVVVLVIVVRVVVVVIVVVVVVEIFISG